MVNVLISGILRGGMYVLIALGLALVYGVMKIPNFAHGEYYLFGAYAAYFALTAFGLPPLSGNHLCSDCWFCLGCDYRKADVCTVGASETLATGSQTRL